MGYALSQLIIVGLIEERERCIIVDFFFHECFIVRNIVCLSISFKHIDKQWDNIAIYDC